MLMREFIRVQAMQWKRMGADRKMTAFEKTNPQTAFAILTCLA